MAGRGARQLPADEPTTSSGKTSQASAPEAEGPAPDLTARQNPSHGGRGSGSNAGDPSRAKGSLADVALKFLAGAGRLNADKRAFTKQRSLSALHGVTKGRKGKGKGGARGRSGGPGRSTVPEGQASPKIPSTKRPGTSPPALSIEPSSRDCTDQKGDAGNSGAVPQSSAAGASAVGNAAAVLGEGVAGAEREVEATATLAWDSSLRQPGVTGVGHRGVAADGVAWSPIGTPPQVAVEKPIWKWARTDSKGPLGLKVQVDHLGFPLPPKGASAGLEAALKGKEAQPSRIESFFKASKRKQASPVWPEVDVAENRIRWTAPKGAQKVSQAVNAPEQGSGLAQQDVGASEGTVGRPGEEEQICATPAPGSMIESRDTTPGCSVSGAEQEGGLGLGPPATPSQPSRSRPALSSWPEAGPIMGPESPGSWPLRGPHTESLRKNKSRKWRGSPPTKLEISDAGQKAAGERVRSSRRKDARVTSSGELDAEPAASTRNGKCHPEHDRVWPPSMREREIPEEEDMGTNSIWGPVATRRRTCYELREVPVNEGFHIMNIASHPGALPEDHRPFVTPFPLQGPDKWRGLSPPRMTQSATNALRKNPTPNFPPMI